MAKTIKKTQIESSCIRHCFFDRKNQNVLEITLRWAELLQNAPQYAEKFNWEKTVIAPFEWIHLLCRQPQFAENLPADCKDGGVWFTILGNRRDFDDRCPWNEITAAGWEWASLLKKRPDLADRCPFDRLDGDE